LKKFKTFFFDIDGTIFKYRKFENYKQSLPELTPGAFDKLTEIKNKGHMIILTTARPENLRDHTEFELSSNLIPYNYLLMGLERGPRYLINDMDPNKPGYRAHAHNVKRDKGLKSFKY
jgi:hypothetical protein